MDLALNNQQWLISHQTKSNQTKLSKTNNLPALVRLKVIDDNSNI